MSRILLSCVGGESGLKMARKEEAEKLITLSMHASNNIHRSLSSFYTYSFAKLRIDPKVLFDDIARSKVDDIASATPFQICQILHSYSSLGKFDVDFFEEIASRCGETLIKEGNSIDVANVLWSLTTANALERKGCVDLATGLWRRVATNANGEVDNMGVESLVQCVQFFISVRHRLEIEEPGEDLMRNMQLAVLVQDASASDGQRQLSEYLKEEVSALVRKLQAARAAR